MPVADARPPAVERYLTAPLSPRRSLPTLRAAAWTLYAVWSTRRSLRSRGLEARVPPIPRLPAGARRGVSAVLRRLEPTCLERAMVEQAWLGTHGITTTVVVGVARQSGDVTAHAWLEGDGLPARDPGGHTEIHRIPLRAGRR